MSTINCKKYGTLSDGRDVNIYTLKNDDGVTAKIINYGGIITELHSPDRNGKTADIVLGFDTLEDYEKYNTCYFGAIIGRYSNRIRDGKYKIDGIEYHGVINNGKNHLHGGSIGFDKKLWDAKVIDGSEPTLVLSYLSPDGEEGYPGNLHVQVSYRLSDDNALHIEYKATTDKATIINLTNHSYFNLQGHRHANVFDQELQIQATHYAPIDENQIPLNDFLLVNNTCFDFIKPKPIGRNFNDPILAHVRGYDHAFALLNKGKFERAATAYDPQSGRILECYTDEPALLLYTANWVEGLPVAKGGKPYGNQQAFCFETQHFPNSPNEPLFPTTLLRPGETFHSHTAFKFSTK